MANENNNERRRKVSRQSWKMDPRLKILLNAWNAVYSVVKVVFAAVATVMVICVVCALVFAGLLAGYLEGDIIPQAGVQIDGFGLNQNSNAYYYDKEGNIQVLHSSKRFITLAICSLGRILSGG